MGNPNSIRARRRRYGALRASYRRQARLDRERFATLFARGPIDLLSAPDLADLHALIDETHTRIMSTLTIPASLLAHQDAILCGLPLGRPFVIIAPACR